MAYEGAPLAPAVKLDIMMQVVEGLEELKRARIVWRDLKAKNMLVKKVSRGESGEVCHVKIAFTDWGTAVKLPKGSQRRMTLHGPGTCGYIAPDTRGPAYGHQSDMWAFLVFAVTLCLDNESIQECELEEAMADLELHKKASATLAQEAKAEECLGKFEGKVEDGCEGIFHLLKTSAPWVDATMRWTCDEALEVRQCRLTSG